MSNSKRIYDNYTSLKALELADESKAIEVISNPDLDSDELNELLTTSILGRIINKDTNKPLKLSNKVMSAGFHNRMLKEMKSRNKNKIDNI